jgi:hypothetical protein
VREPLPFDHAEHADALERAGLGCVACHPVGLRRRIAPDRAEAVPLPAPPRSACHACHVGEVARAGRGAPMECSLCHDVRAELRPADHALDWIALHAAAARAPDQACSSCHTTASCLDCHDRRGAGAASPHGVGFARFHGVEAQLDPRRCSTCHTEASCTACHTSGGVPW